MVRGSPVVVRRHLTRGGAWMLFLTLQDQTDLCEVVIMPDAYPGAWPALAAGGPGVVRGPREVADHGGVIVRAARLRALWLGLAGLRRPTLSTADPGLERRWIPS